ncbi:MAG: hypothetical protein ACJAVK_000057 [Akkermansiaceae bacterium]
MAQDLEPGFIAVSPDSRFAYVTLQENNAVAIVNLKSARVTNIEALGLKDDSLSGLDASNRDHAIDIQPWPVLGMYQPDALALYQQGRRRLIVTSNEGDARDDDGLSEEVRLSDLKLDLLYDSGSDLENFTASLIPAEFNSTNDENDFADSRSDDKGPEPEGIALAHIGDRDYAFIGLERVGGVMVFDITTPETPVYLQYLVTRDFFGEAEEGTAGALFLLLIIPLHDPGITRALLLSFQAILILGESLRVSGDTGEISAFVGIRCDIKKLELGAMNV